MAATVPLAFDQKGLMLPIEQILPLRAMRPELRLGAKYQRLLASIREIGLIEPVIVHPQSGRGTSTPMYLLLDGHTRVDILRELGRATVFCLVATDDEAFTYNHKVNRMSPIQEHFMIMKALDNGVAEERIAATLNVDVGAIRRKRDLLAGICPEAIEILKDRGTPAGTLRELRRVQPLRQIEMAELMQASNCFTSTYAKCLVAATSQDQMAEPEKPKEVAGIRPEDVARMERELESLSRDFRLIEESHGRNTLVLVLAVAYLRKLLDHAPVLKYLGQRYPDLLAQLQRLVEASDLNGAA